MFKPAPVDIALSAVLQSALSNRYAIVDLGVPLDDSITVSGHRRLAAAQRLWGIQFLKPNQWRL